MQAKDWKEVRERYVSGQETLNEIAKRSGLSFSTLRKKSATERWVKQRNKYRQKQVNKAVARAGAYEVKRLAALQSSSSLISDELLKLMNNIDKEIHRFVYDARDRNGNTKPRVAVLDAINDKKLVEMTQTLKEMTSAVRKLYDIPTEKEKARIRDGKERLELQKNEIQKPSEALVIIAECGKNKATES